MSKVNKRECGICCSDKFNFITCQYCGIDACNECQQKYILEKTVPGCMSCKKEWTYNWLRESFPKSFINKTYKAKKELDLFELEKVLLPEVQEEAAFEKQYYEKIKEYEAKVKEITKKLKDENLTRQETDDLMHSRRSLNRKIQQTKRELENRGYQERLREKMEETIDDIFGDYSRFVEFHQDNKTINYNLTIKTNDVVRTGKNKMVSTINLYIVEFFEKILGVEIDTELIKQIREIKHFHITLFITLESDGNVVAEFMDKKWTVKNVEILEFFKTFVKSDKQNNFSRPCPKGECRGFFGNDYKCGLCNVNVCKDCFEEVKEEHKCDENTVKSVKALLRETKPCPKCNSLIYKVAGCFGENIPILLWNGDIKMSQDIKIGDCLIGDDGSKRVVEDICSGEDDLYLVKQSNGISYVVNSKHTMVLKDLDNNTVLITIDDYNKLDDSKKSMKGFNSKGEFSNINITKHSKGQYFGFRLDGNNRFLLEDFTVVKNCDQMWCTICKTAFSWKTGQIENGRVHNPHYWEFMRQVGREDDEINRQFGNGDNVVQNDDNACFDWNALERCLMNTRFNYIFQKINHLELVDMQRYRIQNLEERNRDLRKLYLCNLITEKDLKSKLNARFKRNNFNMEVTQIIEMFIQTTKDTCCLFFKKLNVDKMSNSNRNKINTLELFKSLIALQIYARKSILKVCETYEYVQLILMFMSKDYFNVFLPPNPKHYMDFFVQDKSKEYSAKYKHYNFIDDPKGINDILFHLIPIEEQEMYKKMEEEEDEKYNKEVGEIQKILATSELI
jgi:hypothetical protein